MIKKFFFVTEEGDGEEGLIMNLYDEEVAYYLKNSVKTFYKKPISSNFKKTYFKKISSASSSSVRYKGDEKLYERKDEKKLTGYSVNCSNYCNGRNHLTRDCMLNKKKEKNRSLITMAIVTWR